MSTMEALRFDRAQKKLSLEKIEIPKNPGPKEIIVQVAYAGVCGTDIHIIHGTFHCKATAVTLGHEFSGIVTEIGSEVNHIKKGDRVAVDPNRGCYCCQHCNSGKFQLCQTESIFNTVGIWSDGGFASYAKVPAAQVHRIPDALSLEHAALTEPIACLSHGVDILGPIPMGSSFLINGAGIIGVLWTHTLHLLGHRKIFVSEPQEGRRKLIEGLGLGVKAVSPQELQGMKTKDPSWGVNVAIDCSGNAKAVEVSVSMLKAGGKLLIFGVAAPDATFNLSPFEVYAKELTIQGVLINPYSFPKSFGFLESFTGDKDGKYLDFKKAGIQMYRLNQYDEALKALATGTISKAMFKIQ